MRKQFNSIVCGIGAAAIFLLVGCRANVNVPEGRVAETTLEIDEAMQLRDWEPSIAYYQNPRFIAGPTGFLYQPEYEQQNWIYAVLETPMFVAQAAMLPVTLFLPPAWTPVEFAGETVPATHHGMPPLPPPPDPEAVAPLEDPNEVPMSPPLEEPTPPGETTPSPMEQVSPELRLPTQPANGVEPTTRPTGDDNR